MGRALARWVDVVTRRPRAVAGGIALATLLLLVYAATHLGVTSDNIKLFREGVEFRRVFEELTEVFPVTNFALVVVVDAETPARSRSAADRLAEALDGSSAVEDVFRAGGGPFFERNGLLYRDLDALEELADTLTRAQPLIALLEREPSLASLADYLRRGVVREHEDAARTRMWADVCDVLATGTAAALDGSRPGTWEGLIAPGPEGAVPTRQVIFVQPRLDYRAVAAAGQAMETIHAAADELGLDAAGGVRVRITGNPALAYEEMQGLLRDAGIAMAVSFLLVTWILHRALRAGRLVVASVLTLLTGLVWTAAFAAFAIGSLNVISVMFAVLFIGLGVDFAIHFGSGYVDRLREGGGNEPALRDTAEQLGGSLGICTLTTALGFFAFIPTDYLGVAELGAIAGTGMLIIFALTFTLMPALLAGPLRVRSAGSLRPVRFRPPSWSPSATHPRAVCAVALLLGLGSLFLLPRTVFDANVIRMRDPATESVQAFDDLLSRPGIDSPWHADVLVADLAQAQDVASRLRGLPSVDRAVTILDFVPEDQEEKRELLADLAMLLDVPAGDAEGPATPEASLAALEALQRVLREPDPGRDPALAASERALASELERFLAAARAASPERRAELLAALRADWLGDLPGELARVRRALDPQEVALEDLPEPLVRRMLAPDGRARVQAYPTEDLNDPAAWVRFADGVRAEVPWATGLPVNLLEFGRVTMRSLAQALASALVAIALLLWLLDRRVADVALVMAPLVLGGLLTAASWVLLGIRLNFANVVVLPLLLGVGVDSGIHLVRAWRAQGERGRGRAGETGDVSEALLALPTARAVFYSALTTTTSFGTLAFSSHNGIASLGVTLALGMGFTLVANLVVLPALLNVLAERRAGA